MFLVKITLFHEKKTLVSHESPLFDKSIHQPSFSTPTLLLFIKQQRPRLKYEANSKLTKLILQFREWPLEAVSKNDEILTYTQLLWQK